MKDYIKIATAICPVCGVEHETNAILLHKNLQDIECTIIGYELCEEHFKEGFITCIGVSNKGDEPTLSAEEAERTGDVCYIKREAFKHMFDSDLPDEVDVVFLEDDVVQSLKQLTATVH
jgi:hypothetical protein